MSFFIPNFYLCIIPLVEPNDTVEARFTRKIKLCNQHELDLHDFYITDTIY